MLLKTSLREIRTSLGRYLAIFSIIALGVGFFAGLRVTRAAMLNTADEYLSELHMFDGRLLSTLGWTQEDVDAFAGLAGVRAAAGVYSADFLRAGESGSDTVLKAYSLTSGINDLCLQAGRLPEKADECVVDAWSFEESDIGKTVRLSENNSADTIDAFAYREYTIVGVANSPIYINYERGGTSLGNGTVSAFVYLPEDGFTLEHLLSGEDETERVLERVSLREAIDRLPERERRVISLRYFHDMTQEAAARVLGVSQVQVSRLERRAISALRELLEP